MELGAWSLELAAWTQQLGACLELGAWNSELGAWSWELEAAAAAAGASTSERHPVGLRVHFLQRFLPIFPFSPEIQYGRFVFIS